MGSERLVGDFLSQASKEGNGTALMPIRRRLLPSRGPSWRSLSGIEGEKKLNGHTCRYCFWKKPEGIGGNKKEESSLVSNIFR